MGCDIHLHTETKINGKWEHMGAPSINRNYPLFTKMAGVRNVQDIDPISEPKGLPEDASVITALEYKMWDSDAHSASWLDPIEIYELENFYEELMQKWYPDKLFFVEREWGYLFGSSWGGFHKYPQDVPDFVEDVRFVFWFDN